MSILDKNHQWDCSSIPGIHEFEGHKVHSASWDNTYDYSYKRIGIIGNGSSSIQFLPEMVKLEGTTVVSFQSGPTYITSSIGEILGVNAGELGVNTVETNMENASGHNSTEEMEDDDGDADSTFKPKVSKASIQTGAAFYLLDVIVCATGFDVSYIPRYPVTGRNNVTLASKWAEEPESYLSLACPGMSNYFIFTGTNTTVSHGTLLLSISWTADYVLRWLKRMASDDNKSVAPSQDATDESALLYRELMIAELRDEDLNIRYNNGNRWRGVLDNGFTELEEHAANVAARGEQVDPAFYVQN
ncbi:hypothetical protein AYO21_08891 [Fonsecaea monophora]|uniref:FAD/NAD(P)-binding domain-containing protein n=1 Tax=Fonsecaea monophora TaxID=254056 RepID=A0A177F099_9EURO|nr:hypothetical protein AYO21_08891 [Fonsecaea monophora]OAG36930.1 hypothetical protein AYO21_08891 [Fonsecaea monophora]